MRWLLILLLPVCSALADDSWADTNVPPSTRRESSLESETEAVEDIKPVRPREIGALIQRRAESPEDASLDVIVVSLRAMGSEAALSWAEDFLETAGKEETRVLVGALEVLGDPKAVHIIAPLLENEDHNVWLEARGAIHNLVRTNPVKGGEEISRILWESKEHITRSRLVGMLGTPGVPGAEGLLVSFLDDRDVFVQLAAMSTITKLRLQGRSVRRKLRKALFHDNIMIQKEAVISLGRLRDYNAVPDLIDLLETENAGLHGGVLWALRNTTGIRLPDDTEAWRVWWEKEGSRTFDKIASLLDDLRDPIPKKRMYALRDLAPYAGLADREMIEEVSYLLEDKSPGVRAGACLILKLFKSQDSVWPLISALDDKDSNVVRQAHTALQEITGNKDLPADSYEWRVWLRRHAGKSK